MRRLQGADHVLSRADARVNQAALAQFFQCVQIKRSTFALRVGAERAAAIRSFLPVEPEPFEIFKHGRNKVRLAPARIEVFIAKDKNATALAGSSLSNPKGPRVAQMQI